MPFDKAGKFHLNTQRANASDRVKPMSPPPAEPKGKPEAGGSGSDAHTTLHDHGDGTFHTESHDGERTDHPSIGHAVVHIASRHAEGGKHMHIHHDGGSHVSHHAGEDGQAQGPDEHADTEALKQHVGEFFGDGGGEGADQDSGDQSADGDGLSGF
jgi:hypothetical protein